MTIRKMYFGKAGKVERPKVVKGQVRYVTFTGYAMITEEGNYSYPWLTLAEATKMAEEDGADPVFCSSIVGAQDESRRAQECEADKNAEA